MRLHELPGFLPSTSGFRFANRWPAGPVFELHLPYLRIGIGEAADGLCGGMCFAAADRFLRAEAVPQASEPPAAGTPLFREIARRQLDSLELGRVPARFWWAAARVAAGRWSARDQVREWRALAADLDAGRPAMAGLVRVAGIDPLGLTADHQVIGFAYEASARNAMLRIYDPNHPRDDEVRVELSIGGEDSTERGPTGPAVSLAQSSGEPLLALLQLPYRERR
ncbi:MAG: hypothetical protein HY264_06075 [Chloroflexi bacterium]|nr:hypothetical protein [Chloroflexota bacterium]